MSEDDPHDQNMEHLLTKPINVIVVDANTDVNIDRIRKYGIPKAALNTNVH